MEFLKKHRNPSYTELIKFSNKVGFDKVEKVKDILSNDEYDRTRDYYSYLRSYILKDIKGKSRSVKQAFLDSVPNRYKKRDNYEKVLKGYLKFKNSKELKFFNPPVTFWKPQESLIIRINPEVGLYINGKPYIIKLDFNCKKESQLNKKSAKCMVRLMMTEFCECWSDYNFAIWDVRRGYFYELDNKDDVFAIDAFLRGEAKSFIEIRDSIINGKRQNVA